MKHTNLLLAPGASRVAQCAYGLSLLALVAFVSMAAVPAPATAQAQTDAGIQNAIIAVNPDSRVLKGGVVEVVVPLRLGDGRAAQHRIRVDGSGNVTSNLREILRAAPDKAAVGDTFWLNRLMPVRGAIGVALPPPAAR